MFAATFFCEKWDRRIPAPLIALVVCALAVRLFDLTAHGVMVLGAIQRPAFARRYRWDDIVKLLPLSFLIALVVIIQTATVSRSMLDAGESGDLNRDLIGVGAGNMLSGVLGGFPANSSPPRSAIVRETGGDVAHGGAGGGAAGGTALFLRPQSVGRHSGGGAGGALAVCGPAHLPPRHHARHRRQSRPEFALLCATAAAIVLTPVQIGVAIGVALSLLYGVWTIIQTQVLEFEKVPGSTVWWPVGRNPTGERLPGVVVAGFQAPLFFLNADAFRKSLNDTVARAPGPVHAIVLESSSIVELDYSAAQLLACLIEDWKKEGITFYVARLESVRAERALERFGILPMLGGQRTFHSVDEAIRFIGASDQPA